CSSLLLCGRRVLCWYRCLRLLRPSGWLMWCGRLVRRLRWWKVIVLPVWCRGCSGRFRIWGECGGRRRGWPGLWRWVRHWVTALVESDRAARVVSGLQREIPDLGRVWRLESGLAEIVSLGAYMDASAVRFRRDEVSSEDAAVVLYPMSTVSRWMRGVVLSHGALLSAAAGLVDRMWPRLAKLEEGRASALLDAPLSEIQGVASLVGCVVGR